MHEVFNLVSSPGTQAWSAPIFHDDTGLERKEGRDLTLCWEEVELGFKAGDLSPPKLSPTLLCSALLSGEMPLFENVQGDLPCQLSKARVPWGERALHILALVCLYKAALSS